MKYRAFTKGVDGKGIPQALHVKHRFPEMLSVRRATCTGGHTAVFYAPKSVTLCQVPTPF